MLGKTALFGYNKKNIQKYTYKENYLVKDVPQRASSARE